MKRRAIVLTGIAFLLGALVYTGLPVYQFFAHQGDLPLPPTGWLAMPADEAPEQSRVFDPAYASVNAEAMDLLRRHRQRIRVPSLSAAAAVRGRLVWAGAVGWADLESELPASIQTRYRIGSTSKALTATGLARLVDQGRISLDASIADYFDPLPNPAWAPITARQLASHSAGIPHYGKNTDWFGLYQTVALRSHFDDVRNAVQLFDSSMLLFEPGSSFEYSSLGTVLLGATMSHAAGVPFRELIAEQVLWPLNATDTVVAPRLGSDDDQLATFYYRKPSSAAQLNSRFREWRPVDLSHRLPGGGFASTPSDLVRIGSAWLDESFISEAVRTAFWTPQRLADGEVNEQAYAIGWRWREWDIPGWGLVPNANHGGVSRGAQCWLLVFPNHDLSIAFTTNGRTETFHEFGYELYEALFSIFASHGT